MVSQLLAITTHQLAVVIAVFADRATTTSAEARLEELGVRVRRAKGGASISAFLLGFVFGSQPCEKTHLLQARYFR